jgi:hypothetical protein
MKRLLLIWILVALAMPASGLASEVGSTYSGPETPQAMEAFVRSVALTGQSSVGYVVPGARFGALSMSPAEAETYAQSLAQTGLGSAGLVGPYSGPGAARAMEAFVQSVALTRQSSVGYLVAGPFGALSMSPTEAEAYARSLAQTRQDSASVVGGGR